MERRIVIGALGILIVGILAAMAVFWSTQDRPEEGDGSVPIQVRYDDKIVYGTDQSLDQDALRAHCAAQGGRFNECGTPCPTNAEGCIAVCAFTCEFGGAPPPAPATSTSGQVGRVKLAVLDNEGTTGKQRGCDRVAYVERTVASTTQPLTAAMRELFSIEDESLGGYYNFIARTNDTLKFDRAAVEDGVGKIYLLGRLSNLAGVCDDPRAQIQIEETALQFPTVKSVEIYLNGEKTILTPSQR